MRTFDDMLSKQLKDDEFRKEYEAIQPEMDAVSYTHLDVYKRQVLQSADGENPDRIIRVHQWKRLYAD